MGQSTMSEDIKLFIVEKYHKMTQKQAQLISRSFLRQVFSIDLFKKLSSNFEFFVRFDCT